jgi:cytochrome c553
MKNALALIVALLGAAHVHAQQAKPGLPIEAKVAQCIGCHGIAGYQASFPEIHKVPQISGQNAKYIAAALTAYQKGDRKHPTMRGVAAPMTDADIAEISAYYEKHGGSATAPDAPAAPPANVAALLTKGACASCHGANYSKPIDGSYPKIAGQYADYLYAALKSYQVTNNANVGRNNAIMAGQVKQFTLAELKLMANYLGSLPGDMKTIAQSKTR